ncbi:MAG: VWA domain-containing protein [Planctomycetales bacterium]|nr:VWA domain-containing protein [Planctomycetales bacterium]
MLNWEIGFDSPWYLLLLLLVPLIWLFSFKSLAGLGRLRRFLALAFRTAIVVLMALCLAEIQLQQTSDKVTVIYVLDQSESIPAGKRQMMLDYVTEDVAAHRDMEREDRAGVIVFGREATIEIPPFDDDIAVSQVESNFGATDATNLEAALKLAQASFPEDSAKRIVVVTDGNENLGNSTSIAPLLAEQGIGIDVVPVRLSTKAEIDVEKVALPNDIRHGQPIEARVVVNNYTDSEENKNRVVKGKLTIKRKSGKFEQLLAEQQVELQPGKNVFPFRHTIDEPAFYTYEADFTPNDAQDDLMPQNNKATSFTYVRGKGRVLLIEDSESKGEFDYLVSRLQANEIEVVTQDTGELFSSLADLQAYDCVILANVPRSSGDTASFSDEQIEMLVRNTQQMGAGLVMLGGPNSFGAGGWANTELEKAMPVDFQIKNTKIQAVGALVLLMHASEMAQGNYWQKRVAYESIKVLGPMDYAGLIHWGPGADEWLWGGNVGLIRVGTQKNTMLSRLNRMTPGDMPQFDPAMRMALAGFGRVNASVKQMIIISDGDPSPPSGATMGQYKAAGIMISTVAIGTHGPAGSTPLQNIATATGGKYYVVTNPKALPRIFVREARKVARPLVYEPDGGVVPQVTYPHEILQGISGPLPPISGFVLTTLKENPLVEVAIRSPKPESEENSTIMAAWTYGLGRTAVLTTDSGKRWATNWTEWENYDKFYTQMIRWAMRPVNEEGKFSVASEMRDGKVRVVVTALDKDDQFLNFLNMNGAAIDPSMEPVNDMRVRQVAPGRYVAEFDAAKPGSYFVTLNPGTGGAPILTGVTVPYSDEFKARDANLALLENLASLKPEGGEPGKVIEAPEAVPIPGDASASDESTNEELTNTAMLPLSVQEQIDELLKVNTFREDLPKAISSQDVWHYVLLISACLFFGDVFVRRVQVGFEWVGWLWQWFRRRVLGRDDQQAADTRLERLRSRKAAVSQQLDERRAAARFEPSVDSEQEGRSLDEVITDVSGGAARPASPPRTAPQQSTPDASEDNYTSRLLEAKRKAAKNQPKKDPNQD